MERLTENVRANVSAYKPSTAAIVEVWNPMRAHAPFALFDLTVGGQSRQHWASARATSSRARRQHIHRLCCHVPRTPSQELDWGSRADLERIGKADVLLAADVVFGLDNPGADTLSRDAAPLALP